VSRREQEMGSEVCSRFSVPQALRSVQGIFWNWLGQKSSSKAQTTCIKKPVNFLSIKLFSNLIVKV
jgi:hypothetical protein